MRLCTTIRARAREGTATALRGHAGLFLALSVLVSSNLAVAPAGGETLALDPQGAATPVLWNGGVAWQDPTGVRAAAPGSATRRLVSFRALGYTYSFALDSGSGAQSGGAGGSGGTLAYGWEEANDMTPPMGPGDTSIPTPALPYETSISHRGLIGADGHSTPLPDCSTQDRPGYFGAPIVSLAETTAAYLCAGAPPGMQVPAHAILPSYLALSNLTMPGAPAQTIPEAGAPFQLSGAYVAYIAGNATTTTVAARRIVVFDRTTSAVVYELHLGANEYVRALALQADGTLVVLGAGTSSCPKPGRIGAGQSFPAVWLSPADPTPHQLGCFYDGALRPVGGQWVALAPTGPGTQASLELLTLAGGAPRTLAVFPNPGAFEPQSQQPQSQPQTEPAADFDGHRLAWVQHTCAGTAIELTPDVAAMSPGPLPSARCPVQFHLHGPLRPGARGVVRVRLSCPLGCTVIAMHISGSRALATSGSAYFSLPASPRPVTKSFRLTRRQLAYLRRRHHVRVVLSAETAGVGSAPFGKTAVRVTLAR
ncbi:MAG TPA: hypothetical protein VGH60_03570 [Solirubrobacteraceae bacterium]